jgi:multicomponent Na+:H+ antiporter subunit B
MSRGLRTALFAVVAAGAAAVMGWGATGLPSFGHYPGPYGDAVVHGAVDQRHASNAVATVVLDYRGVDTAGEEMILLAAAIGTLMLLRKLREESDAPSGDSPAERTATERSAAVQAVAGALIAPLTLLGIYVVVHGHLTPGGGFQGGVVLAAPSVAMFLAAPFPAFDRLHQHTGWEIGQSLALTGFMAVGFATMVVGGAFLDNVMPLGSFGTVFSAGTLPVLNLLIGPAVATAIVLVAGALLHQVAEVRPA